LLQRRTLARQKKKGRDDERFRLNLLNISRQRRGRL
jgi:hypothetical protein